MSVQFPPVSEETRVRMLQPPKGRVKAVLDTDTFNEIDDQFADRKSTRLNSSHRL